MKKWKLYACKKTLHPDEIIKCILKAYEYLNYFIQ